MFIYILLYYCIIIMLIYIIITIITITCCRSCLPNPLVHLKNSGLPFPTPLPRQVAISCLFNDHGVFNLLSLEALSSFCCSNLPILKTHCQLWTKKTEQKRLLSKNLKGWWRMYHFNESARLSIEKKNILFRVHQIPVAFCETRSGHPWNNLGSIVIDIGFG